MRETFDQLVVPLLVEESLRHLYGAEHSYYDDEAGANRMEARKIMHFDESTSSPVASSLTLYRDSNTDEIVAVCDSCGAKLRFAIETASGKLNFEHEAECPWMLELEARSPARQRASSKLREQ